MISSKTCSCAGPSSLEPRPNFYRRKHFEIYWLPPYHESMKQSDLIELQSSLLGSVTDNPDALAHFATDQSIFQAQPIGVAYPQNTADVRKLVKYAAEKAATGKTLPLIPRGKGSDQGGA